MVNVEVIYIAEDQSVFHKKLTLALGACVGDAMRESGLYLIYPETESLALGIFSRPASLTTVLREGDRLEVYRVLRLDPKQTRRERAKGRAGGKARRPD